MFSSLCVSALVIFMTYVVLVCGSVDAFLQVLPKPADQNTHGTEHTVKTKFAPQSAANKSPWDRVVPMLLQQKSSLFIFPSDVLKTTLF